MSSSSGSKSPGKSKVVFKTTRSKDNADGGGRAPAYENRSFEAGEWIFREGDLGTEMYIIREGRVEILKRLGEEPDGDDTGDGQGAEELRQISVLEKGDFFGEMALLEDLPRAASARALDALDLVQIDGSTFVHMLQSDPEIAVRMMRKLSRRLRETDALVRRLGGRTPAPSSPPSDAGEGAVERLVHRDTGEIFHLSEGSETTIGRKDAATSIFPDIDLTSVDGQRSISRRHAKIYRRGDKWFLVEEIGTMNGTFINGERLETGSPREIEAGDEVRFGVICTHFRIEPMENDGAPASEPADEASSGPA